MNVSACVSVFKVLWEVKKKVEPVLMMTSLKRGTYVHVHIHVHVRTVYYTCTMYIVYNVYVSWVSFSSFLSVC